MTGPAEMRCAVVLGGGRSSRMGTDKLALTLAGATLLDRVVAAALGWAERVVVASPMRPGLDVDRVTVVLETPPFGGPAAGLAAAVAALPVGATELLVLAGDLAAPDAVVWALADATPGRDGVVLEDGEGWPQFLAGRYRADALRAALAAAPTLRDVSVRRVLRSLDLAVTRAPSGVTADVDTPDQARRAGLDVRNYDTM